MSSQVLRICLTAALLFPGAAVLAQNPSEEEELTLVYGDNDSISIATGNVQSLRRAPAVATVITAADIAAMGATDLDQVLEGVPGVHVNRSANNYAPLYVVRGIFSQFTPQLLMLQNGVPITTVFVGNKGNLWGGYPVEHIARIEIIRGPGSALYGSDAFSGVINIITKNAADTPGTEFGLRAGSFNTKDAWVQHGGQWGDIDVAAYLRVGRSDGMDPVIEADAASRNDRLFGTRVSRAPGTVNTGRDAVDANLDLSYGKLRARFGYKLRDKLGTGAGIASALDPVGQQKSERITSNISWTDTQFAPDWGVGASVSTQQYKQTITTDFQLLPPGTVLPTGAFPNGMIGGPDYGERNVRLAAYADYSGFARHQIRIGTGYEDLDLYRARETRNFRYAPNGAPIPLPSVVDVSDSDPFIRPHRRKIKYIFVQDEWRMAKDWTLTAGVRHDRYSDFGTTTNPRLALVWDATYNMTAKLLYGRAFRAPSFNESYGITNPVALGNPGLRPEKNGTLEAVFAWQAANDAQVNLSLYRYSMQDIIRTVPNAIAGTGATYSNTGGQKGTGAELETVWHLNRAWRLSGNYAFQRSIDKLTGQDAGYVPRHHLYGRADWQFTSGYLLSTQLNWVAGRRRAAGDLRPAIDDYKTVDLSLSTQRGRQQWNFSASVRNLFNTDAREPSLAPGLAIPNDLPMAPRAFSIQASYKL
ncbi:TonB-dependent siderophore receptor [Massilia sp. erpn]|uniref:TonB-dependent receptor plug domain-containing protein n=1 Tax=Massilia sp. erpn TaxID=2738142 RepID=UPI00210579AF|nr:TonB-dependent receptor [Massilia sp. erpn]UTY59609.1 TonB-dependent receptor [Massilia sp. erpn]